MTQLTFACVAHSTRMKYFGGRNGVPPQEEELPAPSRPLVRRFVSADGEPVTLCMEEKENITAVETNAEAAPAAAPSRPTLSCSNDTATTTMVGLSSPLSSLLECGPGMEQLMLEPATTVLKRDSQQQQQQQQQETTTCMDTTAACTAFDTEALKTALLLDDDDDKDESSLPVRDSPQQQQQQARRSKSLPEHALLDTSSLFDDSTVDFDLVYRLNKSDTDLCEGESPGTLRLTEEGLRRHERKTMAIQSSNGKYVSSSNKRGLSAIRLASNVPNNKRGLFQKSLDSVQHFMDYKEQVRIEKLRQKEIERQRKREAQAKRVLPSKILHMDESSLAQDTGIEVMNEPMLKKKNKPNEIVPEKKLTTSVQALTCIVCSSRERTHIAVPCMHFSFCEPCAKILKRNQWACPVCGTPHTTYNQVFA
jgi:rubrerythrin